MGGPPNLATWSPRQHRRQRPIRPRGALCPEFLHSRGVTCACQKATFAPITGHHGRVDQLHVRPVSGHAVEDEIASCAPLAWVCVGDGRAISNGRLVCDRPTRRTRRRCRRQPEEKAILFGRLLPNRRSTDAIVLRTCSVLGPEYQDFREDRAARPIENGITRSRLGPLRDKASEYKLQTNSCRL